MKNILGVKLNLSAIFRDCFLFAQNEKRCTTITAAYEGRSLIDRPCCGFISGLGDSVCGVIPENGLVCSVYRMGVNDKFSHFGLVRLLLEQFGLCGEHIAKAAEHPCYVQ